MENLLVKLMLVAALAQFGLAISDLRDCRGRKCVQMVENRARDVLRVDWRAISLFPNEAGRFR